MRKHWEENGCDHLYATYPPKLLYRDTFAPNNLIHPGLVEIKNLFSTSPDHAFEAWVTVYTDSNDKSVNSVTFLRVNGKEFELIRSRPTSLGDEF